MAFGDFTVTRASTKLRIGSNGLYGSVANNVPAFEFNADGTYRGLLVEPAATNLVLYSQEFDNAYWAGSAIVTANTHVSPDGTTTADTFDDNTSAYLDKRKVFTIAGNAPHTFSFFIRKTSGALSHYAGIAVLLTGVSSRVDYGIINTTTGTINRDASSTVNSATYRVENYVDYWRVSLAFVDNQANTSCAVIMYPAISSNGTSIDSNAQGANVFWQAQLETGSVATSPIVTTAGTASRVADVVSLTGASSLIGQTEGTVYAEVQISAFGNAGVFFSVSDATTNNRIQLYKFTDAKIRADRISATQSTLTSIATDVVSAGMFKVAFAYKTGDSALFINGVQIGSTATQTFTFGAMGRIDIGARFDSTQIFNDHIRSVALFPTRLANATLQALTT
jgi:hypothetical protein